MRDVVATQVRRSRELLAAGRPLVGRLHGWSRLAVAGYVAGGLATADALDAADYDVLDPLDPAEQAAHRRPREPADVRAVVVTHHRPRTAYRECERITREQARNFSWGIRLLPAPKRTRAVGGLRVGPAHRRHRRRRRCRPRRSCACWPSARKACSLRPGMPDDPVLVALDDAARRLPIPLDGLRRARRRLRDGRAGRALRDHRRSRRVLPLRRRIDRAARRSGCSTHRCRADGFGHASALADALGVALQLTNILRDIREDLGNGRVYLPRRDLELFGVRAAAAARRHP